MRMRRGGAAALVLLLAAGCLGSGAVKVAPYLPLNDAKHGRGTEFALFVQGAPGRTLPVRAADLPERWRFEPEAPDVTLPRGGSSSVVVRITPDENATFGPHTVGLVVGGTRADVIVNVVDLGREPLRAGVGAQVLYVLWRDNGTVIETNDRAAADQPGLSFVRLGADPPDYAPLKVYVGGKRGTPPPEPYNSTGCDAPPCYHPVIPGFDRRLRNAGDGSGMVAGETLAVRVNASDAYTYPGNENHPVYGQNLNFLIGIVSVDALNARTPCFPVCG